MAESETAASLFFRLPLSTVYKSLVINPQVYDYRYVADDLAFVRQCMKLIKIKLEAQRKPKCRTRSSLKSCGATQQ